MLGNGEYLQQQDFYRAQAEAARAKLAAMTPKQRRRYKRKQKKVQSAINVRNRLTSLVRKPTHTGPLTPEEETIRQFVVARDWDGLFTYAPPKIWGPHTGLTHNSPAKYSFQIVNGQRRYIPFSDQDYRSWIFSKWYTIQPGYTCSDAQREAGVAYHNKGQSKWRVANPPTHQNHVFPFYPGGGARGQSFGCEKKQESTWVKIRKPLAIAAGAVAAVTMGPAVLGKIGSAFTGGGAATGAGTGIVGAGAKAGAVTAVTTKAGAGIALTKGAAATAAAAKAAPSLFASIKATGNNLLKYYNQGATIKAIANGEMPPPPISIEGDNFLDWATKVAIDEVMKDQQRKLTQKEQELINLEMARLQSQLVQQIPSGIPAYPNPNVPIPIQTAMVHEKEVNAENANLMTMGLVGLIVILAARGM